MWELDYRESWAPKNWCFWTVVLEETLESPLDSKDIQPVLSKRDQSWVFTGRTDVETETPILWLPDAKSWLIWKDPDAGERLKAGGEGDDRGWDGWMVSLTQWIWVWVNSGSWWWTGRPGVLQFMGLQRVGHDWVTELNWTYTYMYACMCVCVCVCMFKFGEKNQPQKSTWQKERKKEKKQQTLLKVMYSHNFFFLIKDREFPGSLVVRIPGFHCNDPG